MGEALSAAETSYLYAGGTMEKAPGGCALSQLAPTQHTLSYQWQM